MKKAVLGVKIDDLSISQIVDTVRLWLKESSKHYIVTPNPEIVLLCQKDPDLKKIINNADLSIPDGVGLKLFSDIENTSPGVDVLEEIVKSSGDWGVTVGFLGGARGIAEKAAYCLQKKYKNARIIYTSWGGIINREGEPTDGEIKIIPPVDLLFVAFGPPKQEEWITKNIKKIPVKVAMGVGGSFDYLSGAVPRAPKILRKLGLEWFFRLIIQPSRIVRQIKLIKYLLLTAKSNMLH